MPARARSTAEPGVLEVLCAQRLLPKAAWDLNRCMRGTLRPATEVRICSDNMMLLPSIFNFKRVRRVELEHVLDDPLLSVSWPTSLEYLSIEGNAELRDIHLPPGLAVEELRVFVDDSRDREGAAWIERVLGSLRAGVLKTFRVRAAKFKTLATVPLPAGILQLELAHACMGSDGDPDDHPPFDKVKVPDSVTELFLDGISLQNVKVPSALNSLDMSCSGVFSSLPDQAFGEMTGDHPSLSWSGLSLAATEVDWDYAPSNINQLTGASITLPGSESAIYAENNDMTIGKVYRKALYIEYTDATFTKVKPTPENMGFLGPFMRAEVGDTIELTFKNNAGAGFTPPLQFSVHPHGVKYTKANEGAHYQFEVNGSGSVNPGATYVYRWDVPERSGPAAADGNAVMWAYHSHHDERDGDAIMWAYHSHHDEPKDTYSGLSGPLIIYRAGTLDPKTNRPLDVDREFVILFQVTNENDSHYLDVNCAKFGCNPALVNADPAGFAESNLMHNINGRFFGNLNGLDMYVGERIRWFVAAFGTEVDLHTAHFHGNTLTMDNHRTDVVDLLPATFRTLIMQPDAEGKWLIHCHVNDHIKAGMLAYYNVNPRPTGLRGSTAPY
ncbi:Cupredoxin [Tribonema minus]|uniref:Cupredoxin n=1 Tax=Tribonema minus TaxID=303371 RepID=A0A835Z4F1_9STRA|nr:Cupredoxin [Tribonema minus]